jgi:hypothetical protein
MIQSRKSTLKSKIDGHSSQISSNRSRRQSLMGTNINFAQQRGLTKANPEQFHEMINLVNKTNEENLKKNNWKIELNNFLDNNYVLIFMTAITIFALFGSSIQAAICPSYVDYGFNIIQILLFGFFSIEIILSVLSKENYFLSFFFWLDIISTISLIQDIDWIFDALISFGDK